MKEHPILFNGEMVRAIMDGRKTQTRRIIQSPRLNHPEVVFLDHGDGWWPYCSDDGESENCDGMEYPIPCPYSQPGDRLWVRETFCDDVDLGFVVFRADRYPESIDKATHWRPSIFMPKEFARIWLKVTDVRVERVKDISGEDIQAEGVQAFSANQRRVDFIQLWNSINEQRGYGWNANPWVWVVEFELSRRPQ